MTQSARQVLTAAARTLLRRRRFVVLALLIVLLAVITALEPVHELIAPALARSGEVVHRHPVGGIALFLGLSAASAMLFFFSVAPLVPVGIHAWGKAETVALLWTGWLLGGVLAYFIGRRPGRRLLRWLMPEHRHARHAETLALDPSFGSVLLFQLAVPSEIPGYVLGALRYHFGKYCVARAVTELPYAVGAVYLGEAFLEARALTVMGLALLGVALSVAAIAWWHRVSHRPS